MIIAVLLCAGCMTDKNFKNINKMDTKTKIQTDNSQKSVLARGCDPELSQRFAKIVPPLIGGANYIPTTDDVDFIEKLKSKKWSVIYFAPGACRFSAAKRQIPGGSIDTQGWTLEQYYQLIYELQGKEVEIVQSPYEEKSLVLLNKALVKARISNK